MTRKGLILMCEFMKAGQINMNTLLLIHQLTWFGGIRENIVVN